MARVPLPGKPGPPQVSNPLPGKPGPPQVSNPLPGKPGLQQVSNPLPGKPGLQQVSNLQLDSNPRNRIVPPIAIPGQDRQVRAARTRIIIPGARERRDHSNTSRAGHSISRAGHLPSLPVRLRHPGRVAAVPQVVPGEGKYVDK
jgi:hypothetical protein